MEALNAKPGTQIKITRTPTGRLYRTSRPIRKWFFFSKCFSKTFFHFFFFSIFFSGSVEFTTVPAAGGGGVISNTAVPGMSSSSDVTITRAPNAHGGAPGGVHAQSSLGNGFASQVQPTSLGQKIFDRPNKDKVK